MTASAAARPDAGPVRTRFRMWDGEVSVLAWERAGPRSPGVHFAHATGFNALAYRDLLDGLAPVLRIHASDLRGHGQSTLAANPKGLVSWQVYADDILRTVQEIDGRPKILAGHSLGATASLMAALAQPQWVSGLVLVEPVLPPPDVLRRQAMRRALSWLLPPARPRPKRGIFPTRAAVLAAYRGHGAFRHWPDDVVRDFVDGGVVDFMDDRQVRLACTPGWEEATYRAGPPNLWPAINGLRMPVTVLVAETGSTCPPDSVALLRARLPDARIVTVPGTRHFLPFEAPEVVRLELRLMARLLGGQARHDEALEHLAQAGRDVHGLALNEIQ